MPHRKRKYARIGWDPRKYKSLRDFLVLPSTMSEFEYFYIRRINRIAASVFALHVPVFVLIGYFNQTGPLFALAVTTLVALGPWIAEKALDNPRHISLVTGVTAMLMGGVLVHLGQGPLQIEMHFYFFALIAMLTVFANPMVILVAMLAVVLHHATLWILFPSSVFNHDANFGVIFVHALFVVFESIAMSIIARSFFDNVIGFEKLLSTRTEEIEKNTRAFRAVLNSITQGLLAIDLDGNIRGEPSRSLVQWFRYLFEQHAQTAQTSQTSWINLISFADQKYANWLDAALEEMRAGILPVEVILDQMPKEIRWQKRTFQVEYLPMQADEEQEEDWSQVLRERKLAQKHLKQQKNQTEDLNSRLIYEQKKSNKHLSQILLVVTDITEKLEHERLEEDQRDALRVMTHAQRNRRGVLAFAQEAEQLVEKLTKSPEADAVLPVVVLRMIHTLKGNASIFGLTTLSRTCHAIEERLHENKNDRMSKYDRQLLASAWKMAAERLRLALGERDPDIVEVHKKEIIDIIQQIRTTTKAGAHAEMLAQCTVHTEATQTLANLLFDPVKSHLQHLRDAALALAERLGKTVPQIDIDDQNLRINGPLWTSFWTACVHLVRNAIDHGIEEASTRKLLGKEERGLLLLRAYIDTTAHPDADAGMTHTEEFVIAIVDDGMGIPWDKIAEKAQQFEIPFTTEQERIAALFADGMSTKDNATEISGRGIGLGAVYDEVVKRGGTIDVQSETGCGTAVMMRFPKEAMTQVIVTPTVNTDEPVDKPADKTTNKTTNKTAA